MISNSQNSENSKFMLSGIEGVDEWYQNVFPERALLLFGSS